MQNLAAAEPMGVAGNQLELARVRLALAEVAMQSGELTATQSIYSTHSR